jgi:hypothetical protein
MIHAKEKRKKRAKNLEEQNKNFTFAPVKRNGTMAERLGNGLQNRGEQFDSAWYLNAISGKSFK